MKKWSLVIVSLLSGAVAGGMAVNKMFRLKEAKKDGKIDKFKGYYQLLNQWIILKQEGKFLDQYFADNGYETVAIYGMGEMGNRLYDELKNSDKVQVKYAVDQNKASIYSDLELLDLEDKLPKVDVIVVTATFAFYEIEKELGKKVTFPIVSLEDIVLEV